LKEEKEMEAVLEESKIEEDLPVKEKSSSPIHHS